MYPHSIYSYTGILFVYMDPSGLTKPAERKAVLEG